MSGHAPSQKAFTCAWGAEEDGARDFVALENAMGESFRP